jgi:glucosamine 6-phosphate synthetase-like amidotransferase/phosphosugar isomerase protein
MAASPSECAPARIDERDRVVHNGIIENHEAQR